MLRNLLTQFSALNPLTGKQISPASAEGATRVNQFGFHLLAEIAARQSNSNVFLSPVGIFSALLLARFGASGETRTEMNLALAIDGLSEKEVIELSRAIRSVFASAADNLELKMATAIWAENRAALNQDFASTGRTLFDAEINAVDFNHSQTLKRINDWVSQKTRGKIPNILDNVAGSSLVLTNAVYFLADWRRPFQPNATREVPFHLLNGQTRNHPLMFQSGDFSYYENAQFQAVKLPYVGDSISLLAFLSAEKSSLQEFLQTLNERNWQKWLNRFEETAGTVGLPRFRAEFESSLNAVLIQMGMSRAFDNRAEFDRILTDESPLFINEARHKSFVKINEEGTEAAAATAIAMPRSAMAQRPKKYFSMTIDRPFFFVIQDERTGIILFAGSITDPAQS